MRCFALISLLLIAASASDAADSTSTYTQKKCYTFRGKSSVKSIPTVSKFTTLSFTFTEKTTVTPTSTFTPTPVVITATATSTSTEFTSTQSTDTATITSTSTQTNTITTTTTLTATSTNVQTTTVTSATTIPTPSGFKPITQAGGYVPRGLRRLGQGTSELDEMIKRGGDDVQTQKCSPKKKPTKSKYIRKVSCFGAVEKVVIQTETSTAAPTTITAAASTTTSTTTAVVTTTSVSTLADSTITLTKAATATTTSTSTASVTVTTVTTSTSTVYAPVSTSYAACTSDNIVHGANGNQGFGVISYNGNSEVDAPDATSCCVACQQLGTCAGFIYLGGNACYLSTTGSCPATGNPAFSTSPTNAFDRSLALGNGPCGYFRNAGSS